MTDLPLFVCVPLAVKIRRKSCGERHAVGRDPTCATCPVGREHRRGAEPQSWPNGAPIRVLLFRPGVGDISRIRTRKRLRLVLA